MSGAFRYKAFISYNWDDRVAVERLHQRLETFRTPKPLIGATTPRGLVPARLIPIFRDRDEEPAGANLRDVIYKALDDSEFLIVVCSPNAVRSKWVTKEIAYFRKRRGPQFVLPYIIAGEPGASGVAGREHEECFPEALRVETAQDGTPTGAAIEAPLAADARPTGDGFKLALLKLEAAMLGVGLDALVQRDAQRRARRMRAALSAVSLIAAALAGLAVFAFEQRNEARAQKAIAEKQRDTATSALNYLVSIYELANPATENPKTITALTILDRGTKKIDTDLKSQPDVQAKLFGALGSVYNNLGDVDRAESLLRRATAIAGATLKDRLDAELQLSFIDARRRKIKEAQTALDGIERQLAAKDAEGAVSAAELNALKIRIGEQRAFIAYLSGNNDEAIKRYTEIIDMIDQSNPNSADLLAKYSTNRGMIYVSRSNFEAARADLERAHDIFTRRYGHSHLRTAQSLNNIALEQLQEKKLPAAIKSLTDVLAVYEKVLEPDHPDLAGARMLLGRTLSATGEPEKAVEPLQESVDGYRAAFGPTNYNVGYALVYLAAALSGAGRHDEAISALDRAQKIYAANFEPGGFDFGDLMVYRAMVLEKAGRQREAAPLCRQGLDILKANLGDKDPYYGEMAAKCTPVPS